MKKVLVLGAGGFIGSHLVKRLKSEGYWVRGVDVKYPEFSKSQADDFILGDLRNPIICDNVVDYEVDEIYQRTWWKSGSSCCFSTTNGIQYYFECF